MQVFHKRYKGESNMFSKFNKNMQSIAQRSMVHSNTFVLKILRKY